MSFEIQELPDIIRVIILINLAKGRSLPKSVLKRQIDRICTRYVCVETSDFDKTLTEMMAEGLILIRDETVQLTDRGIKLGKEWRNLLLKKEPIIEVVAGLTDGSITGLVVVLSSYIANLSLVTATFAALLTLVAVAITNFSSFLLGGITEDLADMLTLQTLIRYSVSDIPNVAERNKSLMLVKQLFMVLHKEIGRANLYAAIICGATTYLAGSIPIIVYLLLPHPIDVIISLSVVGIDAVVFMRVINTKDSLVNIQNLWNSVMKHAQTTMRDVVGNVELDDLLARREEIAERIEKVVEGETQGWGVDIISVKLQNVELPEDMKRVIARQAEAEREKRAVIIKSEGELTAATNLEKAVQQMSNRAMYLRTLSSLEDISYDQSNTIVFALPMEIVKGEIVGLSAFAKASGEKATERMRRSESKERNEQT